MTHLYLIRHAEYVYAVKNGRYRDLGLSAAGIVEAERLRDRLARTGEIKADVVIVSPERGARETAEVLAPVLGAPSVLDVDVEEWRSEDGSLSPEEFLERWRQVSPQQRPYRRWVEGCETRAEFSARVQQALSRIVGEQAGKTTVVVTHGAFIQLSFQYFFGYGEASLQVAAPEVTRTSITHWYESGGRWVLERSNDHLHLEYGASLWSGEPPASQ